MPVGRHEEAGNGIGAHECGFVGEDLAADAAASLAVDALTADVRVVGVV